MLELLSDQPIWILVYILSLCILFLGFFVKSCPLISSSNETVSPLRRGLQFILLLPIWFSISFGGFGSIVLIYDLSKKYTLIEVVFCIVFWCVLVGLFVICRQGCRKK